MAHRFSCSAACGIFPEQGSNLCPLHWQADSSPLHHQGSPTAYTSEESGSEGKERTGALKRKNTLPGEDLPRDRKCSCPSEPVEKAGE